VVPIAYGGSTKEGKVSFSTGIDKGLRADLVISIMIVERDGGDVISVACGGKEHGMQTHMNARTLTKLVYGNSPETFCVLKKGGQIMSEPGGRGIDLFKIAGESGDSAGAPWRSSHTPPPDYSVNAN
jgi:hypothetical protein